MTRKNESSKKDFIKLFLKNAQDDSRDAEAAREHLQSEGYNVDRIQDEGLSRIKQMQLLIDAQKTEEEMNAAGPIAQRATEWVDQLLSSQTFSLKQLVEEEELTVSFSHIQDLSREELRHILIRHFTLKFMKE